MSDPEHCEDRAEHAADDLRVLIVAEHASLRFGGEAALPVHYFRVLRKRGDAAWLITHERTREELAQLFPGEQGRIQYVPDTIWHRLLWRAGRFLPPRISWATTGLVMRFITQCYQRRMVRRLVRAQRISVVHQPIPVSPMEPSLMYDVGAPVVIGPMNGGMGYPPGFRNMEGRAERFAVSIGRLVAQVANLIVPGKRRAALLLVANERTRVALPRGTGQRVELLVENGVDLALWDRVSFASIDKPSPITRYAFVGRLVNWKAVDLLLRAFKKATACVQINLLVVGDGAERVALERLAQELGVLGLQESEQSGHVSFAGWLSQAECARWLQRCDALVLPSLMECGGAVVLEAMASGLPVIATNWGGPADYLDASCGILVTPQSPEDFVERMAQALVRLATSPEERKAMGAAAYSKVRTEYDWNAKVDHIARLYRTVIMANALKHTRHGSQ